MRGLASYLLAVESVLSDTAEEAVETGQLRIPPAGT